MIAPSNPVVGDSPCIERRSDLMLDVPDRVFERGAGRLHLQTRGLGYGDAGRQQDRGAYVRFLADNSQARVQAAYPGTTWDRLAGIKARYDPTSLFQLNHNIPPAVE
jgi:hypothetical protein